MLQKLPFCKTLCIFSSNVTWFKKKKLTRYLMPRIIKWHFVFNLDGTVNNLGTKLNFT